MEKGTMTKLACMIPALVAGALALSFGALHIGGARTRSRRGPAEESPAIRKDQEIQPRCGRDQEIHANAAAVAKKSDPAVAETKLHRLALQVNANEPAAMNLALNNASNVAQYYKDLGETVEIEIVAYGPGLHMLRHDTSPVKDRIKSISKSNPNISFTACGNTQQNMQKAEATDIPLVPEAQAVKSGVVRLMELQEQGWSYIRP